MEGIDNSTSRVNVELNAKDNASVVIGRFSSSLTGIIEKLSKLNEELEKASKNDEKFSDSICDLGNSEKVIDSISHKIERLEILLNKTVKNYSLDIEAGKSLKQIEAISKEIAELKKVYSSLKDVKDGQLNRNTSIDKIKGDLQVISSDIGRQLGQFQKINPEKKNKKDHLTYTEASIRKMSQEEFLNFKNEILRGIGGHGSKDNISYIYKLLERMGNSKENIDKGILSSKNQVALLSTVLHNRSANIGSSDIKNYREKVKGKYSGLNEKDFEAAVFEDLKKDKVLIKDLIKNYLDSLFKDETFTSEKISKKNSRKIIKGSTDTSSGLDFSGLEKVSRYSSGKEVSDYITSFIKSEFSVKKIENDKSYISDAVNMITSLTDDVRKGASQVESTVSECSKAINSEVDAISSAQKLEETVSRNAKKNPDKKVEENEGDLVKVASMGVSPDKASTIQRIKDVYKNFLSNNGILDSAYRGIDSANISQDNKNKLKDEAKKAYDDIVKNVNDKIEKDIEKIKNGSNSEQKMNDYLSAITKRNFGKEFSEIDSARLMTKFQILPDSPINTSNNPNYYNADDQKIEGLIEELKKALGDIVDQIKMYSRDEKGNLQYNGRTLEDNTKDNRLKRDYEYLIGRRAYYTERIRGSENNLAQRRYERENPGGWNRFGHDLMGALYFGLSSREANARQKGGWAGFFGTMGHALAGNVYKEGEVEKRFLRKSIVHHAGDRKGFVSKAFGDVGGKNLYYGGAVFSMFGAALEKATDSLGKFSNEAMEAFGSIQSIKTNLEVVFGNQTQSDAMFQQLSEYAVKSPFGVEQTSEQAVLLRQSGIYSSDLLDTMKRIGDVAGGNVVKMERIASNYAKIVSMGNANMMNMRQFAYAGLPIYAEVAKELKVSQSTLRSMIKDGQVTSDIIEKVFQNMTNEGGTFFGAVDKGAKTYQARKMNLQDSRTLAMSSIGEYLYTLGAKTDTNQGYLSRFLNFKESVYDGLQKWYNSADLRKTIAIGRNAANSEDYKKLQKLKDARDQLKVAGVDSKSPELKALEQQIKELENSLISYDALVNAKASFTEQYNEDMKKNRFERNKGAITLGVGGFGGLLAGGAVGLGAVGLSGVAAAGGALAGVAGLATIATGVAAIATGVAGIAALIAAGITMWQKRNAEKDAKDGAWAINQRDVTAFMATASDKVNKIIDEKGDREGKNSGSSFNMISSASEAVAKGELETLRVNDRLHFNNVERFNVLSELDKKYLQKDGTYKFDELGISIKDLAKNMSLLAQSVDELDTNIGDLYTGLDSNGANGHLNLKGKESLETLKSNFDRIKELNLETVKNGKEIKKYWEIVKDTLEDYNTTLQRSEDYKTFLDNVARLQKLVTESGDENLSKILSFTMSKSVLSTEDKEKLVERTKAPVWAKVLANNSGMNASRIYFEGSPYAMGIYKQRNSRDAYANLSKSLLSMGYNLKDIRNATRESGLRNRNGKFDWNENWDKLSTFIAGKEGYETIEERDALVSVYQSLVDKIDELEISGITTEDDADMIYSLAQALGPAFDWASSSARDFAENITTAAEALKVEYTTRLKTLKDRSDKDKFNKKYDDEVSKNRQYGAFAGYTTTFNGHVYAMSDSVIDDIFTEAEKKIGEIATDRYSAKYGNEIRDLFIQNKLLSEGKLEKLKEKETNPTTVVQRKGQYVNNDDKSKAIRQKESDRKALLSDARNGLSYTSARAFLEGKSISKNSYSTSSVYGAPLSKNQYEWGNSLTLLSDGKVNGVNGYEISRRAKILKDSIPDIAKIVNEIKKAPIINANGSSIISNDLDRLNNMTGIDAAEVYLQIKHDDEFKKIFGNKIKKAGGAKISQEKQDEIFKEAFIEYVKEHFGELAKNGTSDLAIPDYARSDILKFRDNLKTIASDLVVKQVENTPVLGVEEANKTYGETKTVGGESYELFADEKFKEALKEAAETAFKSGDFDKMVKVLEALKIVNENAFNEIIIKLENSERERELIETAVNAGRSMRNTLGYRKVTDFGYTDADIDWISKNADVIGMPKDKWSAMQLGIDKYGSDSLYTKLFIEEAAKKKEELEEEKERRITIFESDAPRGTYETEYQIAKIENLSMAIKELSNVIDGKSLAEFSTQESQEVLTSTKKAYDESPYSLKKQIDETNAYKALDNRLWRGNVGGNSRLEAIRLTATGFDPDKYLYQEAANIYYEKNKDQKWYQNFRDTAKKKQGSVDENGNPLSDNAIDTEGLKAINEETLKTVAIFNTISDTLSDLKDNMAEAFNSTAIQAWNGSIKESSKNIALVQKGLRDSADAERDMKNFWMSLGESLSDTMAQLCTAAGLHLIITGAYPEGAALIAAGGLLSVFSGLFAANQENGDTTEDETKRLEQLKNSLAELLKQAKADADYYARAITHSKALSANSDLSYGSATSVNDMILTPHGTFSTHPDDYLIATKTPGALVNSGNGGTVVNFSMVNQSGSQLKVASSKQRTNSDGSIDIEAVVTNIMESKLSDGSMNNAIAAGQVYGNGYSVVG